MVEKQKRAVKEKRKRKRLKSKEWRKPSDNNVRRKGSGKSWEMRKKFGRNRQKGNESR